MTDEQQLPGELGEVQSPVVLFFGLLRPYKGLDVLLDAWRGIEDAELWIVGRPRMPIEPLRARAPANVRFVPRYVSDAELPAFFRRAEVVVLPYSRTERFDTSGVLATALAFGKPTVSATWAVSVRSPRRAPLVWCRPETWARYMRLCRGCSAIPRSARGWPGGR